MSTHPIRIAILVGGIGRGGAERQLLNFLRYADKDTFEYHLLVLNRAKHDPYDPEIQALGIGIRHRPNEARSKLATIRWLIAELRQIKPQLIHSWSFYSNAYAGLAGFLAGIPARLGSMRTQPEKEARHISRLQICLAYQTVQELIVNSQLAIDSILEDPCHTRKLNLVENGVEMPQSNDDEPSSSLLEFGIADQHRIIANVANLQKIKNQRMFIDVIGQVLETHPEVRAVIVGQPVPHEPDMYQELKEYVQSVGLEGKVILTGVRTDVPQLMPQFDVFCLTSSSEGTPNVILEAMSARRPIVSTSVGDVPNIITHGKNGLLVDVNDVEAMTDAIRKLLNEPQRATEMGDRGYHLVQSRFSCDRMATEMQAVYQDVLDK